MRRIGLAVVLALSLVLASLVAEAQQAGKLARVGLLFPSTPAPWVESLRVFRQRLLELGWTEDKNLILDFRYADNKADQLPALAAELAGLKPDVIFAAGSVATRAAVRTGTTIPIVFETYGDAVNLGLVPTLARPGGTITGVSGFSPELAGKHLQLIREIVPRSSRVAVLANQGNVGMTTILRPLETAARQLGVKLDVVDVRRTDQFESAFEHMTRRGAEALVVLSDPMFTSESRRIVQLATRHRLPSVYEILAFADEGGLLSYGPARGERWQQVAGQIDRILRGASAGDLPVQQPTKFALVINLKTAKALGITIPQSVLLRADQVIE
jgi:putative tryptophan/tyrosine transport system substrate-binding protein